MAPARPAPGNREHLCEAILIEPDRLYTSELIPLIAQQHPHILYIFVHTKMRNFSARLPKYLPMLKILQLGPEWETTGKPKRKTSTLLMQDESQPVAHLWLSQCKQTLCEIEASNRPLQKNLSEVSLFQCLDIAAQFACHMSLRAGPPGAT